MLLHLFTLFCFKCKENGPAVSMKQDGTMATVMQTCANCGDNFVWRSQPLVLGKYPAGNILLSFAILWLEHQLTRYCSYFVTWAFVLMLYVHSLGIRDLLFFPLCYITGRHIKMLKEMKDIEWSGDGRFDSMGHSAKYGVYTMFCTTIMKIAHFELVQVSEIHICICGSYFFSFVRSVSNYISFLHSFLL